MKPLSNRKFRQYNTGRVQKVQAAKTISNLFSEFSENVLTVPKRVTTAPKQ
jgi:hypothetical protein